MPVRKPVFDPPFNIVRASHVEFGVRDLAASRAFYVDCLGYLVSDETPDALYLRGVEERNHHSIVLRKAPSRAAHALGFKVASEETSTAPPPGSRRKACRPRFPNVPHQGRTLRTADVTGMPLEFYFRMDQARTHAAAATPPTRARASSASTTSTASRPTCRRATTSTPSSASG